MNLPCLALMILEPRAQDLGMTHVPMQLRIYMDLTLLKKRTSYYIPYA